MKKLFCFSLIFIALSFSTNTNEVPFSTEIESFQLGKVSIKWTAYKHSSKIPVNGAFEKVEVTNFKGSSDLTSSVTGTKFKIPISSINTNDKTRDAKIISAFFKTMINTSYIYGSINNMNDNGSGKITLTMNNKSIEENYSWNMDKNTNELYIKTSINVLKWGAQNALNALNKVCLDRHTGTDGVNKLWPDVDITVIAEL